MDAEPTIEEMKNAVAELLTRDTPEAKEEIYHLLAHIGWKYYENGQFGPAIDAYRKGVQCNSNRPDTHYNLADILYRTGNVTEAAESYLAALSLCPNDVDSLQSLAAIRMDSGNVAEAELLCRRAIQISPHDCPNAHRILAAILSLRGDTSASKQHFAKAATVNGETDVPLESTLERMKIRCGAVEAQKWSNLFKTLMTGSQHSSVKLSETIRMFEEELRKNPQSADIISQLYAFMQVSCDWRNFDGRMKKLADLIDDQLRNNRLPPVDICTANCCFPLSLQQQLNVATYFAQLEVKKSTPSVQYHLSGKQLRVGYILTGPTKFPVVGHRSQFHSDRFKVFCYSLFDDPKLLQSQIPATSHLHVVDISKFQDGETMANRIAADGIHILINLHDCYEDRTILNMVLSRRPAPIQVVYRSKFGSTGASYVDYFITDKAASPLEFACGYSEKLAYMPNGMFIFDSRELLIKPLENLQEKRKFRRDFHLPESAVVFGVRSESFKIDPNMFDCWCEILRNVAGSVLWLVVFPTLNEVKINLKMEAERRKIDPNRLIFAEVVTADFSLDNKPMQIPLEHLVDVVLDTSMCNSGTVLYPMSRGIPVVTLPRESFTSRLTASMLTSVSCEQLIAKSTSEYVEIAVNLGNKPELLHQMKDRILKNLPDSILFRVDQFYNDLENLYMKMWKWRELGEKPEHLV